MFVRQIMIRDNHKDILALSTLLFELYTGTLGKHPDMQYHCPLEPLGGMTQIETD